MVFQHLYKPASNAVLIKFRNVSYKTRNICTQKFSTVSVHVSHTFYESLYVELLQSTNPSTKPESVKILCQRFIANRLCHV